MKTFHNEEIYIKTDNFSDSIFKENTMFFDIETTGFSPIIYRAFKWPFPAESIISEAVRPVLSDSEEFHAFSNFLLFSLFTKRF